LIELSKDNHEIQKLTAFSNIFERLFEVINEEGGSEGNEVVQSCLVLLNNLLDNNISTQNIFRETNCVSKLRELLKIDNSDMWILTDNKKSVLVLTLKIISILVSGSTTSTRSNQEIIAKQGIFSLVIHLALGKVTDPR
jgi:intracellular protein transport protein USO1